MWTFLKGRGSPQESFRSEPCQHAKWCFTTAIQEFISKDLDCFREQLILAETKQHRANDDPSNIYINGPTVEKEGESGCHWSYYLNTFNQDWFCLIKIRTSWTLPSSAISQPSDLSSRERLQREQVGGLSALLKGDLGLVMRAQNLFWPARNQSARDEFTEVIHV